jgi:hypothetical protein
MERDCDGEARSTNLYAPSWAELVWLPGMAYGWLDSEGEHVPGSNDEGLHLGKGLGNRKDGGRGMTMHAKGGLVLLSQSRPPLVPHSVMALLFSILLLRRK